MKTTLLAGVALVVIAGCQSIESATVSSSEIVANGGESVAVIQASVIGLTAIFHIVDIIPADLDKCINKVLVGEAKAMGATKVDLKSASTTPKGGAFALWGTLIGFPTSTAVGIAVK